MAKYKEFTRTPRTKKGKIPSIRLVTPDHEAYQLFLKGKELQKQDGIENEDFVDPKYIKKAQEILSQ